MTKNFDHTNHTERGSRDLLDRFARYEPSTALREDALERILSAREHGERRVLPAAAPAVGAVDMRPMLVAVAATIMIAVLFIVRASMPTALTAGELSGTLIFAPANPEAGAHVVVRYRAPANLLGSNLSTAAARAVQNTLERHV